MIGKIINPHGFRPGYCCVWWMCRIMIWFNFRNVELIGKHRIPKEGPLLVCGSHSNQFIDAAVLISEFPRELYFLVAAVSLNHKYLKYFLKFLNVIATTRPQDLAVRGAGTILSLEENIMKGEGTKFTKELEAKFSIHQNGYGKDFFILEILDDTTLRVDNSKEEDFAFTENKELYKYMPKVDQAQVFDQGWQCLNAGNVLAVFPEGGSHDRTDILPQKAGIAIFCLGSIKKYGCNTQIISCGINYDKPHKFRSIAILDYGELISVTPERMLDYGKEEKKSEVIGQVMEDITNNLKNVKLRADSYEQLMDLNLIRALYTPDEVPIDDKEKLVLGLRISEIFKKAKEFKDVQELMAQVDTYRSGLKSQNISDWQLKTLYPSVLHNSWVFFMSAGIVVLTMTFGLPGLIYMLPFKLYIEKIAESKRREALAKSNVKVRGNDVVASWKTLAGCAIAPVYFAVTNLIFYIWYSQRFAGNGFLMRCLVTWVWSVLGFIYLAGKHFCP